PESRRRSLGRREPDRGPCRELRRRGHRRGAARAHLRSPLPAGLERAGATTTRSQRPRMNAAEKMRLVANAALDLKAEDVVALDVHELSSFADYFVVCTGRSDRQVRAIAEAVE